jgi:2-polyprenyl-6-methoxyphenol hydroxylase-like FAD-dependent oxidoreductase
MPINHIIILGAGPAGLASALAISQALPQARITLLELRARSPSSAALGGAVNLTPLAMRYLDRFGVGAEVRRTGIPVRAVDNVSLRTGGLLGQLWKGVDGLRVHRASLVGIMRDAVEGRKGDADGTGVRRVAEVRYGVRVVSIVEEEGGDGEGRVKVGLEGGGEVVGDVLLGCDGLHSVARRLYVEPERREEYSGKVVAYGIVKVPEPGHAGLVKGDGRPVVEDTAMLVGRYGAMVVSFFEQKRREVFVGAVMNMRNESEGPEGASKDGWRTRGADKEYVKAEVQKKFGTSAVVGLREMLNKVDDWTLYPVYMLPSGGRWSKGRILLLGDAAHTVCLDMQHVKFWAGC